MDPEEIKSKLAETNKMLVGLGLAPFELVDPRALKPQEVNARYMDQQTIDQLTANVSRDGRLESVPLVVRVADELFIVSGHHRVEAAVKAELAWILVMVTTVQNDDELKAKQLSHNSLVGIDDVAMLKRMYDEIDDLSLRMYAGLQDELKGISLQTLGVRIGMFEEFTVAFAPGDIESFDAACEAAEELTMKASSVVRVAPKEDYAAVAKAIQKVKRVEDIKSNATALAYICQIALERIEELKKERDAQEAAAT